MTKYTVQIGQKYFLITSRRAIIILLKLNFCFWPLFFQKKKHKRPFEVC